MDANILQSWWAHKQGLDGSLESASPAEVLERTGWARSVGGANPYLTLFARTGISREDADSAAAHLEIHELPAARGCTYVVPASDFALAMTAGQGFGDEAAISTAVKFLGVTEKEIDQLCQKVLQVLKNGPKDPRELKEPLGAALRNLGEAGKKKGITTTLPLALGRLQSQGQIRRIPTNGRLDQQRYAYAAWSPSPLQKSKLTKDDAHSEMARHYFRWIGPASVAEFQWFSGLGVKAAKSAVEGLGLSPIEPGSDLLILQEDADALRKFKRPTKPQYSLVSCIDGILLLRRKIASLIDPKDLKRNATLDDGQKKPLGGLADLPSNAILDRGRVVGLWEYDPATESIAYSPFIPADKEMKAAVAKMEAFIRDQLGDARSFSLDSPESRAPRIAALRKK